jgi:nucleoside-diphosphate-sugar epimerase
MYLEPDKIPIIGQGKQWVSVVSVEGLAEFVWQVVESQRNGILHPNLIYRCRQKEFASLVKEVTKKQTHKLGRFKLMWMEKQMRESVLASIKLDDGMGNQSENQTSKMNLKSAIEEIYSGF